MIRYPYEVCRRPGCSERIVRVSLLDTLVEDGLGPQGDWACAAGHSSWVWPHECDVCPPSDQGSPGRRGPVDPAVGIVGGAR